MCIIIRNALKITYLDGGVLFTVTVTVFDIDRQ